MAFDVGSSNGPASTPPDDPDARPDVHDWLERIFFSLLFIFIAGSTIWTVWSAIRVGFEL